MKKTFLLTALVGFIFILTFCKKDNSSDDNGIVDNNSNVGTAANAILSSEQYKSLNVEIIYMQGHSPSQTAIANFENFLIEYLNKPNGINIILHEIPASGQATYSVSDISSIESNYRNQYNDGEKITASLIFLDGKYTSNNQVLGIAYKNTSMAVFDATIDENSGGISQPSTSKLESVVMNHEFGHLMGLVNIGSEMVNNHEDENNQGHCQDSDCLMYYASETTEIASFLINSPVPDLDNDCKQDIIANGGK